MRRQTVLITERLEVTTWTSGDLDELQQLHSDPLTTRYVRHGRPDTRAETEDLLDQYLREQRDLGRTKWRVADHDGAFIGRAGFGRSGDAWELGYTLNRSWWGEGLATEVAAALVQWHQDNPGDEPPTPLTAIAAVQNVASHRVLERVGFVSVGTTVHSGMKCMAYRRTEGPRCKLDPTRDERIRK